MDERTAWMGLALCQAVTARMSTYLVAACGSAAAVWDASEEIWRSTEGVSPKACEALQAARPQVARDVEAALAAAKQRGAVIVTMADAAYPLSLRNIYDPPPALYVRGAFATVDDIAVAIVGSRHPTAYGIDVAERLARELAERGVTVVSGMARGIDGAAHRGALAGGGRTIAVLGSGLAHIYPPEHAQLAETIARSGAVISEFPLHQRPDKFLFPQRNRLISGLSLGVLVVEAAAKSGALITASAAAEQGKEVMAVPGKISSPMSAGTHGLLKDGASLITCLDDVLAALRLEPVEAVSRQEAAPAARDVSEARLLACLSDEPCHVDDLAAQAGLASAELSSLLLQLELSHRVRQWPGQFYTVCSQ